MTQASDSLSGLHQSRLLTNCKYADELLAQIESMLACSTSRSAFPRFRGDFSLAQSRVVQDYISRLRSQMVSALKVFSVEPVAPDIGAIHAIRTNLDFVHIAFEEMRAGYLCGYGAVPESQVAKLDGIVNELQGLVDKLDRYLVQAVGRDIRDRLSRLEGADHDAEFLGKLEWIVDKHGLVEFRPALEIIIDRMETKVFEIALFGRVSSGKSSLLNHILRSEVLPVGVNSVTSVPTRLRDAAAQFHEMRQFCREVGIEVRSLGPEALEVAASDLLARGRLRQAELSVSEEMVVASALTRTIAKRANLLYKSLKDYAGILIETLGLAGSALEAPDLPAREELASIVREMPKPDLGSLRPETHLPVLSFLGNRAAKWLLVGKLRAQIGPEISSLLKSNGLLLES